MKFILGHIKGTRSKYFKRPDGSPLPRLYFNIRADHGGKSYEFDRLEKNSAGVALPRLKIYDSDDYPDGLIKSLLETEQIVEFIVISSGVSQNR